ncbi:MAG: hypothetical protein IK095_03455 [Oscillospiraceae bacterium]|nr:hypothetical protein [Oscillospiraceae bacterium]
MTGSRFFCDKKVLGQLLRMDLPENGTDAALDIELTDDPYLLRFSTDEKHYYLKIYTREEQPSRDEERTESARLDVDRSSGRGESEVKNKRLDAYLSFYLNACKRLSSFVQAEGLVQTAQDLDPERAGILLERVDETLRYRVVEGDERPDLTCVTASGEKVKCRPYRLNGAGPAASPDTGTQALSQRRQPKGSSAGPQRAADPAEGASQGRTGDTAQEGASGTSGTIEEDAERLRDAVCFDDRLRFLLPEGYEFVRDEIEELSTRSRILFHPFVNEQGRKLGEFTITVREETPSDAEEYGTLLLGNIPAKIWSRKKDVTIAAFKILQLKTVVRIEAGDRKYLIGIDRAARSEEDLEVQARAMATHLGDVLDSIVLDGTRGSFEPLTFERILHVQEEKRDPDGETEDLSTQPPAETREAPRADLSEERAHTEGPDAAPGESDRGADAELLFRSVDPGPYQHHQYDLYAPAEKDAMIGPSQIQISFRPIRELALNADGTFADLLRNVAEKDTGDFELAARAEAFAELFRPGNDPFANGTDRRAEIRAGHIRYVRSYEALRSFAWTLSDACAAACIGPDALCWDDIVELAQFLAGRDRLNFQEDGRCASLCGGNDIHVFFVPRDTTMTERRDILEQMNRDVEELAMRASIGSLEGLRDDLHWLYPAMEMIHAELEKAPPQGSELLRDLAEILYAWCSVTCAARSPVCSADGPAQDPFVLDRRAEQVVEPAGHDATRTEETGAETEQEKEPTAAQQAAGPAVEPVEPAEPAEEPAEPADEPAEPVEEPAEPAEEPAEPAEEPAEPVEEPEVPAEEPEEPAEGPVEPAEEQEGTAQGPEGGSDEEGTLHLPGYDLVIPEGFLYRKGAEDRDFIAWIPGKDPDGYSSSRCAMTAGEDTKGENVEELATAEEYESFARSMSLENEASGRNKEFRRTAFFPLEDPALPGGVLLYYGQGCARADAMVALCDRVKQIRFQFSELQEGEEDEIPDRVQELLSHLRAVPPVQLLEDLDNPRYTEAPLDESLADAWEKNVEQRVFHLRNARMQVQTALVGAIKARRKRGELDVAKVREDVTEMLRRFSVLTERHLVRGAAAFRTIAGNAMDEPLLQRLRDAVSSLADFADQTVKLSGERILVKSDVAVQVRAELDRIAAHGPEQGDAAHGPEQGDAAEAREAHDQRDQQVHSDQQEHSGQQDRLPQQGQSVQQEPAVEEDTSAQQGASDAHDAGAASENCDEQGRTEGIQMLHDLLSYRILFLQIEQAQALRARCRFVDLMPRRAMRCEIAEAIRLERQRYEKDVKAWEDQCKYVERRRKQRADEKVSATMHDKRKKLLDDRDARLKHLEEEETLQSKIKEEEEKIIPTLSILRIKEKREREARLEKAKRALEQIVQDRENARRDFEKALRMLSEQEGEERRRMLEQTTADIKYPEKPREPEELLRAESTVAQGGELFDTSAFCEADEKLDSAVKVAILGRMQTDRSYDLEQVLALIKDHREMTPIRLVTLLPRMINDGVLARNAYQEKCYYKLA